MGYVGSSTTNNNWYYQSFFADIDYCNLYLSAILAIIFLANSKYEFRAYMPTSNFYTAMKLQLKETDTS